MNSNNYLKPSMKMQTIKIILKSYKLYQ